MSSKGEKSNEGVPQLIEAILRVFPYIDAKALSEEMRLGQIEGWDSMNSINLQVELEKTFGVNLSDFPLGSEHTVAAVVLALRGKGAGFKSKEQ